jgi:membrane protease YdiL (CAAX protease family)
VGRDHRDAADILDHPAKPSNAGLELGLVALSMDRVPRAAGYTLVAYLIIWGAGFGDFYNTGFAAHVRERFGLIGWSDLATLVYFLPLQAFFGIPNSMSSALGEEIGWRGFMVPELAGSMSFSAVALRQAPWAT